ncbi:glycoside hydrolase family 5 protein [Ciceribacter sp. L1K23]|uniref:glycoside hydrolase family 5 protein n=1 Tax=Ciceribacter sp. L1K23 TaxID=2820276 RepID=UPI001B810AF8|nr:glycoside hydrolase family 5 protein [Ciceribacter sp. L1K23]MBR0557786.1 glycoside hydrolase family 5 protein [Ciceribacter sp. L1K23]
MIGRDGNAVNRILASGLLVLGLAGQTPANASGCLRGINLSGAEFGGDGGNVFQDYVYPSEHTVAYFAEKGFTSIRLPFRWERLQPELFKELDPDHLRLIEEAVVLARQFGMSVVLDPHNYARYRDKVVGSPDLPDDAAFADFWGRLAERFANANDISFGLMNEPFDIPTHQWVSATNAAIAAIRAVDANNLVLVPGTHWTGAHAWQRDEDGGNHATVMLGVVDPADNFAYEVHQYFDDDFSGTKGNCSRADDAIAALQTFTTWLRENGKRGYLGEFGVPTDASCRTGLEEATAVVETADDVWVGWAYWVAGDWWPESEPLNIQPTGKGDRPQLSALQPFLSDSSGKICAALEH